VSRRWDLLRPLIGAVLAEFVPDPREVAGDGTVLVDGTICPVWDWTAIPDLFSGKAGYPGMNVQVAATLSGDLAAVGPVPVPGARHDAHAYAASGLKNLLASPPTAGDLGYTGVDGIEIVPYRTPPGGKLHESQATFNTALSKNPRRRRARNRSPEDLADTQRGRRPIPPASMQIRIHSQGRHRTVLLQ